MLAADEVQWEGRAGEARVALLERSRYEPSGTVHAPWDNAGVASALWTGEIDANESGSRWT